MAANIRSIRTVDTSPMPATIYSDGTYNPNTINDKGYMGSSSAGIIIPATVVNFARPISHITIKVTNIDRILYLRSFDPRFANNGTIDVTVDTIYTVYVGTTLVLASYNESQYNKKSQLILMVESSTAYLVSKIITGSDMYILCPIVMASIIAYPDSW